MTGQLILVALSAVLAVGTAGAWAQEPASTSDPTAWESVVVPGGFVALQQAMLTGGVADDWHTIPLAIELSFGGLDGLRVSRNISSYAALLRRLHERATAMSPDRTLALSLREGRREAFDALLETLGLEFDSDRRAVRAATDRPAIERTRLLERAGLPMNGLAERLNSGEVVALATKDAAAPLPLGASFWNGRFDPVPPSHDLLWAILSSREMSSLYYALLDCDDETLAAVRGDAKLASALVRHALVLPSIGPALRVHGGRVVPAGGAHTGPLWEALVGKRLGEPADFVNALLGADEGRLAYFYRALAILPAPSVAWITAASTPEKLRRDRFRRLYASFGRGLGNWRPDAMLQPSSPGPADVLMAVALRADGTIAGPPWSDWWRRVFAAEDWPSDPARDVTGVDPERQIDAAGVLDVLCPDACDPRRLAVFALVQREFPEPTIDKAPALFAVARARIRYPALGLDIARMQLADPAVYAALASVASRVEGLSQPDQALALVQLQSAIALLTRLHSVGAAVEKIRDAASSLGALPVTRDGFDGGIIRWIATHFSAADESLDDSVIRLLAGTPWQSPGPSLEWEGTTYRLDIARTEAARLHAVREKFSANTLSSALALVRLADGLPDAIASGSIDASIASLTEVLGGLRDIGTVSWSGTPTSLDPIRNVQTDLLNTVRKLRASDRSRIERAGQSLRAAADAATADALAALVYSMAIQDPDNPFTMSGDLPRKHRLQPIGTLAHRAGPWNPPEERVPERTPRYISGALLGLEAGVPQLALRRLATTRPDAEPNLSVVITHHLQRTAALGRPWRTDERDFVSIETAHAKGSTIDESWQDRALLEAWLARAGISGARSGWLRWASAHGQPIAPLLTIEDRVRLGGVSALSSWGVGVEGTCLCFTFPSLSWERQGAPRIPEAAAVTIVEPALRTALELRQRHLPAALAPGVLALVMTDVAEQAALPHPTDVPAIAAAVRRIPSSRFEDYIAAVAARGPLVPVSEEIKEDR